MRSPCTALGGALFCARSHSPAGAGDTGHMPGNRETFYTAVYDMVRRVPRGRVMTYGDVALALGAPMAPRAVGYALHNLPVGTDVPWWRIINVRGEISLKGRGAQADLQREILESEGVAFSEAGRTELRLYRWWPGDEVRPR